EGAKTTQMNWPPIALMAILASSAVAQPKISGVVNSATFKSDVQVSSGSLASLFGTGLSDKAYSASALPLPVILGQTELLLCSSATVASSCAAAQLVYVGPTQINFLVPENASSTFYSSAVTFLKVRVAGVFDVDATANKPVSLSIVPYSPGIFFVGYDCLADSRFKDHDTFCGLTQTQRPTLQADRGAITDQAGRVL